MSAQTGGTSVTPPERTMLPADLGLMQVHCQSGRGDPPMDCIWPDCPCGLYFAPEYRVTPPLDGEEERVAPRTIVRKGVAVSTLMLCINRRAGRPDDETTWASSPVPPSGEMERLVLGEISRMKVFPDDKINRITLAAAIKRARAALGGWRAAADVLAERKRQVEIEGWTPEHDDQHGAGEMSNAAAYYALSGDQHSSLWPWDWKWCKRSTRRSDLVKAGALIIAEIERLDRAENGR